jgi:hypothetical protein
MLEKIVDSLKLPGQDQPLRVLVRVLRVEFTLGNCQVQYQIALPGAANTTLKEGVYNFEPPKPLLAGLSATFEAMLPGLLANLTSPPEPQSKPEPEPEPETIS